MVQTPLDFFTRRTGRLYFDIESVKILKEPILSEFMTVFNWGNIILEKYRVDLDTAINNATNFK